MTRPVSPATRQQLREAMERLFNGKPQRTDGRLTKNNLCQAPGLMESWLAGFQGCGDRLDDRV
jgi:hypothetical protein